MGAHHLSVAQIQKWHHLPTLVCPECTSNDYSVVLITQGKAEEGRPRSFQLYDSVHWRSAGQFQGDHIWAAARTQDSMALVLIQQVTT